jgi:hypothetical protein
MTPTITPGGDNTPEDGIGRNDGFYWNGKKITVETWMKLWDGVPVPGYAPLPITVKNTFLAQVKSSGKFSGNMTPEGYREVWRQIGYYTSNNVTGFKITTGDVQKNTYINAVADDPNAQSFFGLNLKSLTKVDTTGENQNEANAKLQLERFAWNNGIYISPAEIANKAKAIAFNTGSRATTVDEVMQEWRNKKVAPLYSALYADDIKAGVDVRDLASNWIQVYAQELEVDPDKVDIKNPLIQSAMAKAPVDKTMTMDAFIQKVRSTNDWQYTSGARDALSTTTAQIKQMFGF